jgi:spore germination cell wall hydrolase CwlJ-like protein
MCLATTIYFEARNQSVDGQWAIAEVALRRRDSGRYGNQLCEVLMQPKQFALTLVSPERQITEWEAYRQSWKVTMDALHNWQLPEPQRRLVVPGADHFLAYQRVSADWSVGEPLHVIGDHGFYRVN